MPIKTRLFSTSKQVLAEILGSREVSPGHYRLTLSNAEIATNAQAGHFVHVLPRQTHSFDPFLRRAFSIVFKREDTFDILFRVSGKGTKAMSQWSPGEIIDLLGPLGKTFAPLGTSSLLIGGGVGTPPMAMLASQRSESDVQSITALIGARTKAEVLCEEDFARYNVEMEIATDDGSKGHHGLVTELLENHLQSVKSHAAPPRVYACGPLPMLRAVAEVCERYQAPCQISLEENMPCGVGVCNGCVIPVINSGDDYETYRRICVDGPVAWAHEIQWKHWDVKP